MGRYYTLQGPEDAHTIYRTREEAAEMAATWKDTPAVHEIAIEAEPIYVHPRFGAMWSVWSDGQIRRLRIVRNTRREDGGLGMFPEEVPIRGGGISDAAIKVIGSSVGSDSEKPEWLGRLRDVAVQEGGSQAKPGGYQGARIDRLDCTLDDGTRETWWVRSEGYFEGYLYEFHRSRDQALHAHERDHWIARECLECGALYDQGGFVEPGEMGCDRCNGETATGWQNHLVQMP
jgi:hypothetical protein